MKFKETIDHLAERGFATRKSWNGYGIIFWGVDNAPYFSRYIDRENKDKYPVFWRPSLACLWNDDWIILPYFWNKPGDEYLPYDKEDVALKTLRSANERQTTQQGMPETQDIND